MEDFRDIIDTAVTNLTVGYNRKVGLLLSGGLDSLSVLLACLDVGIKPTCYTFYLDGVESDDIKSCRKIADIFNLDLVEIKINFTSISLLHECKQLIQLNFGDSYYKRHIKTCVQTQVLMKEVPKYVKEKIILTALNADDLQYNTRHYGKMSVDKTPAGVRRLEEARREDCTDDRRGSYIYFKRMFEEYGISFVDVYRDKDVMEYFFSKSYKECTSPKSKYLVYKSFKDEIDTHELYRTPSSFQVNSGTRERFEELLTEDPRINVNGHKTCVGILNDLWRDCERGI